MSDKDFAGKCAFKAKALLYLIENYAIGKMDTLDPNLDPVTRSDLVQIQVFQKQGRVWSPIVDSSR